MCEKCGEKQNFKDSLETFYLLYTMHKSNLLFYPLLSSPDSIISYNYTSGEGERSDVLASQLLSFNYRYFLEKEILMRYESIAM